MDWYSLNIPAPVALAFIAVVGYLFGQRTRRPDVAEAEQARRELKRAKTVAKELETIAESVRRNLAAHHVSLDRFKDRMSALGKEDQEAGWALLCKEAEDVLRPTLRLASQIAHAYDEIRQQSNLLMTFTEVRTDPLTRVSNRRALDETLDSMFSLLNRYGQQFSLAIFDIDHFKAVNDEMGHLYGDRTLQGVARIIDEAVRDTDIVARYGGEEFVVIMPHTPLGGACSFTDRLRAAIEAGMDVTVSGGVAAARTTDSPQSLLARADAALYGAKAAGRNCVYRHDGEEIDAAVAEAAVAV